MRKKFITAILPLTAGLAIVGAGFSAWVFTESEVGSLTANGTVAVTELYEHEASVYWCDSTGNSATQEAFEFTITADQGGIDNTVATDGITTNPGIVYFYVGYTESTEYTVTFSYTFEVATEGGAATYLEFQNEVASAAQISDGTSNDGKTDVVSINLSFYYVSGKKPTSVEEYNSMSASINGQTFELTLTVTAEISAN